MKKCLDTRLDALETSIKRLETLINKVDERLTEVEKRLSEVSVTVKAHRDLIDTFLINSDRAADRMTRTVDIGMKIVAVLALNRADHGCGWSRLFGSHRRRRTASSNPYTF